ncbi:MAG: SBBP repeat-containing protein, partial [Pseudomonadota bacterium]
MNLRHRAVQMTKLWLVLLACTGFISLHGAVSSNQAVPGRAAQRLASPAAPVQANPVLHARIRESYGALPLGFELNSGQAAPEVKAQARGAGHALFLMAAEAVFALSPPSNSVSEKERSPFRFSRRRAGARPSQAQLVRMQFLGANPSPRIEGVDPLPGKSNYFSGRDPSKWRTGIASYERIRYSGVYPGIDLVYYGNGQQLEYDFILAAGADPNRIRLAFEGIDRLEINPQGDLAIRVAGGELQQHRPHVYQEVGTVRKEVEAEYVLESMNRVHLELGAYDRTKQLTIDPVLSYATYLGGTADDSGSGIAVDPAGYAYVTGGTWSTDFPTTPGSLKAPAPNGEVFVCKLNPAGTALVYSTCLGGSNYEAAEDIALDAAGNVFLTGQTTSSDFPTTPGAFQTTGGGSEDVFVAKLNTAGNGLIYSTYLAGSDHEQANGIAVDAAGNAYTTGFSVSTNFPTTAGAFQTSDDMGGFVTKLN